MTTESHPHYRIELTSAAVRDLDALPNNILRRIDRRILSLAGNPRPRGSKKLKGEDNLYRIRVGDYRIILRDKPSRPSHRGIVARY